MILEQHTNIFIAAKVHMKQETCQKNKEFINKDAY